MRIRRVAAADAPFLERMMLFAGFPPDEPLPQDAHRLAHVRRFVDDWGRPGDVGVIAVDDAGRPLGAAWARRRDPPLLHDSGGAPVAELAIALEPDARGAGRGTALLRALHDAAAAAGHRELSLRASPRNPALRLYERAGYELVREGPDGLLMRRRLSRR